MYHRYSLTHRISSFNSLQSYVYIPFQMNVNLGFGDSQSCWTAAWFCQAIVEFERISYHSVDQNAHARLYLTPSWNFVLLNRQCCWVSCTFLLQSSKLRKKCENGLDFYWYWQLAIGNWQLACNLRLDDICQKATWFWGGFARKKKGGR